MLGESDSVSNVSLPWLAQLVAVGQVTRRVQLTAACKPGTLLQAQGAFKVFLIAMVVCLIINAILSLILCQKVATNNYDAMLPNYLIILPIRILWHYIYMIILAAVLFQLRGYVRRQYAIPGNRLADCCCSCLCPCLVLTQMMRHTTDYDIYPSVCCSETGIPPHAPEIV